MDPVLPHNPVRDLADDALWLAYVEGRDEALNEVRRRYEADLMRYLQLSLQDAKAALQQLAHVLALVVRHRASFDGFDSLRGWLLAVATQTAAPAHARQDDGLMDFLNDLKRRQPVTDQEALQHALANVRHDVKQPFLLVMAMRLPLAEAAKACRSTEERTAGAVLRACRELTGLPAFRKE